MNAHKVFLLLVALSMVCILGPVPAHAAVDVSDFDGSWDGWDWQWHIDGPVAPGADGQVSLSTDRGFGDGASLLFNMGSGFGDDGTLWIEKSYSVPVGQPVGVSVSFQLFNMVKSDFNNFDVKAHIGQDNPDFQWDFTYLGYTDSAAGWVPFDYGQTVTSSTGEIWVAVGIRVAHEVHRDYWIDHVVVVPEPATLAVMGLGGLVILRRRSRR